MSICARWNGLIWPDLIILGGGVIKKMDKFVPLLTVKTEIVPAQLLNDAGIVGAALAAQNLCINLFMKRRLRFWQDGAAKTRTILPKSFFYRKMRELSG